MNLFIASKNFMQRMWKMSIASGYSEFSFEIMTNINVFCSMHWNNNKKTNGMRFCFSYLVGTTSLPSITNSHDVILMGQAMWPKLSRTKASHDEYGVCESLCNRSERCNRARLFGVVPPELGDVDGLKRSIQIWNSNWQITGVSIRMKTILGWFVFSREL